MLPRDGGRASQSDEEAAVHIHFFPTFAAGSAPIFGLCGVWHVPQGNPCECSAVTTVGNHFGFAESTSWQRAQRTLVSGRTGFADAGSSACFPCGP
jgi:hypothetical protein